ncbi:radical SAM/SPASM domain-containing protein [Clostridium botulinum]|uniref:Radical SAM/SPASM domain-containing protein n=1 Tax=Clostridium botulinum TaxID=1491 RepID=A0A6G4HQB0_CLOBO|nr:radical SAM/SPASM domain-containing protein [Clostridium botulinum]MBN3360794.1 radical SAM/SPASM domain-containing protein [Clostridium botulinum]MBO0573400.1 radical SAM/SPASM domain-containing protein [Clostridium botulinum]MBO0583113.1 radical SAM/SPASM domain-containing protein [Clostridium botulinum]MCR1165272.1 radical SAM protein [Clostridium botulinum]NFJ61524.1 radical SAM/SPASM domain-containing protein [Clostridium botulinum]
MEYRLVKRFKKFYIEITNVCNLACDFCPETRRKPQFMPIEIFDKILDQIKPYTDYIYFHVKGEPLLHPDIDKFLDLSYKKGFKVNITTNGTLINKAKDKIIMKKALRQVNFSLHSFDGNENSKNKDKYINDILSFVRDTIENNNIFISLRLWNLDEDNKTNLKKKRNAELLHIIEKEFKLPYKIEEKITPGKGIKIYNRIYINQDHEFEWPDLKAEEDDGKGFCYGLRNQVAILVDGTVVPCCLDGEGIISLGNINEIDFSKIIDSERANNILDGFSRREAVEELCKKCGYRKKFSI